MFLNPESCLALLHNLTLNFPNYDLENQYGKNGPVCGVDEAGRGPLAGPVVVAAVILDPHNIPASLNDSKKLTEKKREVLFPQILEHAHVSIRSTSAIVIDQLNIRVATLNSMRQAIDGLSVKPAHALIDGNIVPPNLAMSASAIVKGDQKSLSIAAASIVAKVIRDRMMADAASLYPQYGFEAHKGYGTESHRNAIATFGPCPLHRMTFEPCKSWTKKGAG